jgi:branched-chain amino acid transport system substrate-binding protein
MNHQLLRLAPVAFAAALALTACNRQETPAPKTAAPAPAPAPAPAKAAGSDVVKIGHVGPISGAIAHLGKDNENGARLAVEEINAAGGVKLGDQTVKLDLVTGDDKADPKDGTLVAQKMIDEGVVALVGHLNSGTTIPASKLYADANLPHISPSATAVKLTEQGFKTTFRVVARDDKQGAALANFAAGPLKAKSVAVIDDRTPYGQGLADEFEKFAKEKGMKVVGREFTNDKASDFNAILTKIRSMKPDVVMYGGMDATAGPMAKQMKALGMKSTLLAGDGVCSPEFIKLAGNAADIMKCSNAGEAVEKLAKGADFVAKYKKRFNTDVQVYSPYSYDAVYVIVEAMKKAGKADRASITTALRDTNYDGLTGKVAFDAKGDIKDGAISMFEVKDGKLTYVSTVR